MPFAEESIITLDFRSRRNSSRGVFRSLPGLGLTTKGDFFRSLFCRMNAGGLAFELEFSGAGSFVGRGGKGLGLDFPILELRATPKFSTGVILPAF